MSVMHSAVDINVKRKDVLVIIEKAALAKYLANVR